MARRTVQRRDLRVHMMDRKTGQVRSFYRGVHADDEALFKLRLQQFGSLPRWEQIQATVAHTPRLDES